MKRRDLFKTSLAASAAATLTRGGRAQAAPGAPGTPGTPGTPGVPASTGIVGSGPTAAPPVVAAPQLTGNSTTLPGGIAPGWVVISILGAGLIGAAMRRLPDSVLATTGAACPLGEG